MPPPIDIDVTNTPTNVFDWGDQDIDDLIALANITIPSPNAVAGQIKPHLTGGAICWTQPWKNWRDPEIQYSSCVVERAILGAGLYSVQPVGGRAWHQSQ